MKKTVMLKNCRAMEKRVSQKELADAIGISERMLNKLEHDDEPWKTMRNHTKEKLNEYFKDTKGWEPLEVISGGFDPDKLGKKELKVEPAKVETKPVIEVKKDSKLTDDDTKVFTLIEFAYEGLNESSSHTDFEANINLLKRILKKYDF